MVPAGRFGVPEFGRAMGQLLYDSLMSVPLSEGPIQNKCNKSVGIKAKEERADVRATQRSGIVTCFHIPNGLGANISRMQWLTFKSRIWGSGTGGT